MVVAKRQKVLSESTRRCVRHGMRHEDKSQIVRNFPDCFFSGYTLIFRGYSNQFSGGNSEWVPPDPFSNSEVKTLSADGSVGSPHVRVGHCQALTSKALYSEEYGAFFMLLRFLRSQY